MCRAHRAHTKTIRTSPLQWIIDDGLTPNDALFSKQGLPHQENVDWDRHHRPAASAAEGHAHRPDRMNKPRRKVDLPAVAPGLFASPPASLLVFVVIADQSTPTNSDCLKTQLATRVRSMKHFSVTRQACRPWFGAPGIKPDVGDFADLWPALLLPRILGNPG